MAYGFYPYGFFQYPLMLGYNIYNMFAQLAMLPMQFMQMVLMIYLMGAMQPLFRGLFWR